ncbi:tetratricopeptide repeat protein [Rhodobacteraceae bacterium B1Z28]|uniref:Tetratricopeptide repeat protein 38 n=1 Tax=Ruegeria haliotis TaxID=2747601 RepID=A0ABX2PW02_9RHOB|nr:tetratricopeptide repeat protein [Ruegeria haliotis]NVO58375.1 tetratricopeptide repeat protein [Ruegeria haliotis]
MLADQYGLPLTTSVLEARDAYVTGVNHTLAATFGASDAFAASVEADPGFALGFVGLARARMYDTDIPGAQKAMATARACATQLTEREAAHLAVFELLLQGRTTEARRAVQDHIANYSRDVLVAQICTNIFGLIGMSGEPGRESLQLAYTTQLLEALGEDWWIMSVHGQALCEVGQLDEAMSMMERSLALNNVNANASHFKAHTLYEQGAGEIGRAYLADWIANYDERSVLHGHLSWHRALWALEQEDEAELWEIYSSSIAPAASHSLPINVLTDAAALLYRAEIAGLDVEPELWSDLSDYASRYFPNPGMSFADIHSALAHAMAGDGDRLAVLAETQSGFAGDLVRPVARAWGAIARQDWTAALQNLTPVMAEHARLGGSRAQRDLLELTYLNILLKSGHADEAHRTIKSRRPIFSQAAPVAGFG